MGIILGLLAAVCYGASDFAGGVGGRRSSSEAVAILSQPLALLAAVLAAVLLGGARPGVGTLGWGALSGLGSGVGTIALYRGLSVGRMGVVAPVSAVLAAGIPAVVGLSTGDSLSTLRLSGLVLALPGIALISRQPSSDERPDRTGVAEALVAGVGFALLFIGLARAGTGSGAWPLVAGQVVAVGTVLLLGLGLGSARGTWRAAAGPAVMTGILGGLATLLYLAATGRGDLSVVAVLTSLYPAVTILLARLLLREQWARIQVVGLGLSVVAICLISVGS
ncbi:MAG: EamA family transporter [Nocardioidaceae bacterium]